VINLFCIVIGDVCKPEVVKSFGIGDANACVLALDDALDTNRAVEAIHSICPVIHSEF
jgi:hypothetical protein